MNGDKLKRFNKILVSVLSGVFLVVLAALLITFFVEKSGGASAWSNIGLIFISMFFALPVFGIMPFWIMLLTEKKKCVYAIILYIVLLALWVSCVIVGWVYPD